MFTTLFDGEQVKHARATCMFVHVVQMLLMHFHIHLCVQYTTTTNYTKVGVEDRKHTCENSLSV